jgi:hypothetical protein
VFKFLLKVVLINPPEVEYLPDFSPLAITRTSNTMQI